MPRVSPFADEHAAARQHLMDQLHADHWTVVGWWNGFFDVRHSSGISPAALQRASDANDVVVMHRAGPNGRATIEARIAGPHWRKWMTKGGLK